MMLMSYVTHLIALILVNILFTSVSSDANKYYKISMVSSEENPGRPALFLHGASPVWDADRQCLFFVDVVEQNVHRLDYSTGKIHTKHIGYGQVNFVSPVIGANRLLVAVRSSLHVLDWGVPGDAAMRLLTVIDQGQPDNVISDGKVDSEGRLWAGTKGLQTGDDIVPDKATFFSLEQETFTHPRIQLRPVTSSSGVAWSINNTVLYYTDSSTQKIEAFDFDSQKGDISGRRTIFDITSYGYDDALPNGLTVDSQGFLWVAVMYGGAVLHIDPDSRQVIYTYKLPVSRVTSLTWGGPNLDELFLTTGRDKLDESSEPLGGAIFTIRDTGSRGLPAYFFRFDNADYY